MNTMIHTPIINTSSFEGMPFLNDDATYYHQQLQLQEEEEEEEEPVKPYQQGDDFRPTFYNPFEIKHRRRTSRSQFKVLEKTFLENPKPNASIRRWLAQKLVMTPRGVQVWFQNRRAKEKTVNSKKSPSSNNNTNSSSSIPNTQSTQSTLSLFSEPLVKQSSSNSNFDFMKQSPTCSPVPSTCCNCNDCQLFMVSTPMTRTLSYPPFYQSDACSTNADEEELLMTPVTPFVDTNGLQHMYDYPIFMNNNQWQDTKAEDFSCFNPQQIRRNMYNDAMLFDDSTRRYSQPTSADRFMQSTEVSYYYYVNYKLFINQL